MPSKSQLLIRAAVINCMARCSESTAPLCCLGEFLEQLACLGWNAEDIFTVERSVLHVLSGVKEKSLERAVAHAKHTRPPDATEPACDAP